MQVLTNEELSIIYRIALNVDYQFQGESKLLEGKGSQNLCTPY